MLVKRATFAVCLLIAFAPPVFAEGRQDLEQTEQAIKQSKERQASLERETSKLEAELDALQQQLVSAAAQIQRADNDLAATEQKLAAVNLQLAAKQQQVDKNRARLAAMVTAALRFSKMPVEAMVMMPGDTKERLRVSRALKMLSDDIRSETEKLNLQMNELSALEQKLLTHRKSMQEQKEALETGRQALAAKLDERQALQKKLYADHKKEAEASAALARKAGDLKELVSNLARRREEADSAAKSKGSWVSEAGRKGKIRSFAKAKGHIRKPATGEVTERFGEPVKGLPSKGISIETRTYSEVVAPYDGEVIFSGTFLTYGKMVIIKHSDGFHTLLAGLGRVDAQSGEFLLEGEPIGAMGNRTSSPRLYVELRKNNQPINPVNWIDGLK